jgi:hypothetical protein
MKFIFSTSTATPEKRKMPDGSKYENVFDIKQGLPLTL